MEVLGSNYPVAPLKVKRLSLRVSPGDGRLKQGNPVSCRLLMVANLPCMSGVQIC